MMATMMLFLFPADGLMMPSAKKKRKRQLFPLTLKQLMGWLTGWLVDCLTGWLAHRQLEWLPVSQCLHLLYDGHFSILTFDVWRWQHTKLSYGEQSLSWPYKFRLRFQGKPESFNDLQSWEWSLSHSNSTFRWLQSIYNHAVLIELILN